MGSQVRASRCGADVNTLREKLNYGWFATWIAFQGGSLSVLAAYILSAVAADLLKFRAK